MIISNIKQGRAHSFVFSILAGSEPYQMDPNCLSILSSRNMEALMTSCGVTKVHYGHLGFRFLVGLCKLFTHFDVDILVGMKHSMLHTHRWPGKCEPVHPCGRYLRTHLDRPMNPVALKIRWISDQLITITRMISGSRL